MKEQRKRGRPPVDDPRKNVGLGLTSQEVEAIRELATARGKSHGVIVGELALRELAREKRRKAS